MRSFQTSHGESDDRLYQKMKSSQGGLMLLVRLHADLSQQGVDFLRMLRTIDALGDPASVFEAGSRLRSTYDWLEKVFGRKSAMRAVIEVAGDVLKLVPLTR